MWRKPDRRIPLEPVLEIAGRLPELKLRVVEDLAELAGLAVQPGDRAAVAAGVDDVRIARVHRDVAALAAADLIPVGRDREAAARRHRNRAVVLLRSVDAVGPLVVHIDPVHLRGLLTHLVGPALAAVEADVGPAVVRVDHVHRVVGVDPEIVVVPVRNLDALGERAAAIDGLVELHVQDIDGIFVVGVGVEVDVVPGTLAKRRVAVDAGERFRRRHRSGRDHRARPRPRGEPRCGPSSRRDGNCGLADHAGRQPVLDPLPVVSAVAGAEDAAVLAAGDHRPRLRSARHAPA